MKKLSPNAPCPCGSRKKYKKCCRRYHEGMFASDALSLMKSRYSAYAAGRSDYIIKTTHPENPDYRQDTEAWKREIDRFCQTHDFTGLEIVSAEEGEQEAYVTFIAYLGSQRLREKSRFCKEAGRWYYRSGEFLL